MSTIKLENTFRKYKLLPEKEFDFGFPVTIKRVTLANPKTRSIIERIQRSQRHNPGSKKKDLKKEMDLFFKNFVPHWGLVDDSGKPVPIAKAAEVLAQYEEGVELYFKFLQISTTDQCFEPDVEEDDDDGCMDTAEAEAKN